MQSTIAIGIFAIVMVAIISDKVDSTAASVAGAVLLLLSHILTVEKAVSYIDFNTLGLLIGMMLFVSVVKASGMFEYIAIRSAKIAKGNPWKIMMLFMIVTACLSAFLDNVTTVLLIGPMTISIAGILKINPVPMLLTQILASNIGGTATLIGDPPNIMIGSAAKLSFLDFIKNTAPVVVVIMIILVLVFKFIYGKKFSVNSDAVSEIMALDEKKSISDMSLLIKSVIMIVLVVIGFITHNLLKIESSVIALTAGTVMLLIGKQDVEDIIHEVEWSTIMFFSSLFVVVGGLVETGVVNKLAHLIVEYTADSPILVMLVLLWASALISAVLNNIPFIATLIPLIMAMGKSGIDITPLWWTISLGACLGGNGTLIGASANVLLSTISTKHGFPITFKSYMKVGFPVMILTIFISTIYLLLRFSV